MTHRIQSSLWARWGLSLDDRAYSQQNRGENDRVIQGHNLVAEYLDTHPDTAEKWIKVGHVGKPVAWKDIPDDLKGWGYFDVLKLAMEKP